MRLGKYDYFGKFVALSQKGNEAAKKLQEIMENFDPGKLQEETKEMHQIEQEADNVMHEVINQLMIEFLPPIEGEDIVELVHHLDDVVDNIEDVLVGLYMFRVRELLPEAKQFVDLIQKSSLRLSELMVDFSGFKQSTTLKEGVIEINTLEEKGDELYVNTMRNLYDYSREFDPRFVITWTRLLDRLERALDSIEAVANSLESILLKNK
ncbi:DUF47 family protein [Peptoniphilus sp. KCTC 25270]|uniref:DUF47 domain-containing protein n=1 Tax=Peptoniphilus sp. KCTC 25270 TaxID=2897414 RepID=UPI001E6463D1|nr:DUF47 family protein [Peptoniphilus sp. KCTC 25270]MCD1146616.1 DUF47 family protein [Peptoniphilus sp. KCTC 25270]